MMQFENVTIIKKANIYFDGNVTSRTIITEDNERITLGIMMPGEYEFATDAKEIMEVLNGRVEVTLVDADKSDVYIQGDSFEIKVNSSFKIKVLEVFDYQCSYIEE